MASSVTLSVPTLASSGPNSITELRMPGGNESMTERAFKSAPLWLTSIVLASRSHSTREPSPRKKSTILFTSVMSGAFRTVIVSSVRSVAHNIGSTAFLLPEGVTAPDSALPPRTRRLSLMGRA